MVNTREVGVDTEQRVARWLREHGWPGAERKVRTGFRTATRTVADQGDLTGTPGLCWQVKSLREKRAGRDPNAPAELAVPAWLLETEQQREASGAVLGLLVVRRWGTTDVGRWWCFMDLADLQGLVHGTLGQDSAHSWGPLYAPVPVRLELQDVVALLRAQGWTGEAAA